MTATLQFVGDDLIAFDHLAGYGAAAIAEAAGHKDVRLRWTDELDPRLEVDGVAWAELAAAVQAHAVAHTAATSWVNADGPAGDALSGLFSPRVKGMASDQLTRWYADRSAVLDQIDGPWQSLDLAMVGSLGAPSYWSSDRGEPRPDYGASRWEMKTRNRGEEFVGNRLRLLARSVAARTVDEVETGLRGTTIRDETGKDAADSRTPTGLMPPSRVDNARAWCALWGISQFAVTPALAGASHTVAHLGHHSGGYLFLPCMGRPWPLGRLRTVLRSSQLRAVATSGLADAEVGRARIAADEIAIGWTWLLSRGVTSVVRFSVYHSDNKSAPEKWAERGERLTPGV